MKDLVSVLLAVYNGEETLKATIESILTQTYNNLELVIVDDGSTDGSVSVVKSFNDSRIRVFEQKNTGSPAAPRNLALTKSRGEFIALCDQDDLWYREKLEKQIDVFDNTENKQDIGIIYSTADLIDDKNTRFDRNTVRHSGFLPQKDARTTLLAGNNITACSALVPKKVIDKVGAFNEKLTGVDDYDLWLRITQEYGILGLPESLCAWRVDPGSLSGSKTKQYIENEKIFAALNDKTAPERIGHGKNIFRIIVSAVVEQETNIAQDFLKKIRVYPKSFKMRIVLAFAFLPSNLARIIYITMLRLNSIKI